MVRTTPPLDGTPSARGHELLHLPAAGRVSLAIEVGGRMVPFDDPGEIQQLSANDFNSQAVPGAPAQIEVAWPVYAQVGRELSVKLSGGHARLITPYVTGCTVRALLDSSAVIAGPSFNRRGPTGVDPRISLPADQGRPDAAQALLRVGWAEAECYGVNQHLLSFGLNLSPGASGTVGIPPHAQQMEICEDAFGFPLVEWLTIDNQACPAANLTFRRVFVPTVALAVRLTNPAGNPNPGRFIVTFLTRS